MTSATGSWRRRFTCLRPLAPCWRCWRCVLPFTADWQMMFVWLGIELLVDTIDGPLARRFDAKRVLPRFSGERLDLIVDYLTYVAVPAFVFAESGFLPEDFRLPAAIAILMSGLFHFSDLESKTEEGFFVGFPAIWNVVLLYLFVLGLTPTLALAIVAGLVVLTFVPILCVHPLCVVRLRIMTMLVTLICVCAAIVAMANLFPSLARGTVDRTSHLKQKSENRSEPDAADDDCLFSWILGGMKDELNIRSEICVGCNLDPVEGF